MRAPVSRRRPSSLPACAASRRRFAGRRPSAWAASWRSAARPEAKPRYLFLAATCNRHGARPYPFGTIAKKLARFSELIAVADSQGAPGGAQRDAPHSPHQSHDAAQRRRAAARRAALPRTPLAGDDDALRAHPQATHEREFLRFKKITADGRDLEIDPRDLYDVIELDQRTDRILPNGVCLLPSRQSCDRGNACLTCDKFATDASHLDDHEQQLGRLVDLIDGRKQAFQRKTGRGLSEDNVWLEQRRREQRALELIIGALKRPELGDSATSVRGAGIDARLDDETERGG
jgi:hypothetical protein